RERNELSPKERLARGSMATAEESLQGILEKHLMRCSRNSKIAGRVSCIDSTLAAMQAISHSHGYPVKCARNHVQAAPHRQRGDLVFAQLCGAGTKNGE